MDVFLTTAEENMPIRLDDSTRWKALLELYSQTHAEITRYRDMEWKVLTWTIVLLGGIIAASQSIPASGDLHTVLKVLMTLFAAVIAFYGTWHIHFIHRALTWNRILRHKIEKVFELHKPNIYETESILDPTLIEHVVLYSSGLPHLISWWLLIWLIAAYSVCSIIWS